MKTKLDFEAPSDLSVGNVRITSQAGEVANWIATPDNRRFVDEDASPGFYSAEIIPAGVAPQSIIFEVKEGVANKVFAPLFSALSATGSGTTFLEVTDKESAIEELYRPKKERLLQDICDLPPKKVLIETPPSPAPITAQVKRLSIGLSQEVGRKRKSWRPLSPFLVQTSLELGGGRFNLEVKGQPERLFSSGEERVRLSLAIEGVRVERLLLPMYQGGTTIELTPSPLSASDVELQVIPSDPKLRALLRALQAGTSDHAKAVRDHVLEGHNLAVMLGKETGDPWGAILSWLLFIRFPDVFGEYSSSLAEQEHLSELAPWAHDSYVIRARQLLCASVSSPEDQTRAAEGALDLLVMAQVQGSPYYGYTTHLFSEMIDALCAFESLPPYASAMARKVRQQWSRDYPLQSSAGASFSWLYHDRAMLKEGVLAPSRPTADLLYDRHSTTVVKGRIESGQISIDASFRNAPKSNEQGILTAKMNLMEAAQESSPEMSPAMSRPAGPPSDPNKGRFGGKDTWGGFALNARFMPTDSRKLVTITLIVEADSSIQLGHGDVVW
ncbi:MAG: hypothetical protein ACXWNQ_07305, partial [Anaerolineales bacterium]